MKRLYAAILGLCLAETWACSSPPSATACGVAGFLVGGYAGAAGLRSYDHGTDWDSAVTGGVLGAAVLGGGSYLLCKWLGEDRAGSSEASE